MNFKNKIDFCIIPSPYSGGLKNLVFFSYKGANKVDEKLCLETYYESLRNLMNSMGYQEIDYCTFESINANSFSRDVIAVKLTEVGARYSKPFEFNIIGDLESFRREISAVPGLEMPNGADTAIFFSTTNPTTVKPPKNKVPEVGEKITLHFYLFLQCQFANENDCALELVGDLYSRENNNTRNFLHITQSDFIRLDSKIPNVILFQSTKTYKDFLNEINFLYKGNFKFVKPLINPDGDVFMKSKGFVYNIIEIKKHINPVHRIVVEVNMNQYYDDMIKMSKKIKKEKSDEAKKVVSLEALKPEMIQLKEKLSDKMMQLAETDEFEKANLIKNDIFFIDNKLKIVDNFSDKNITQEEYFKTFCLSN